MTPMRTLSASALAKRPPRLSVAAVAAVFFSNDRREVAMEGPALASGSTAGFMTAKTCSIWRSGGKVNARSFGGLRVAALRQRDTARGGGARIGLPSSAGTGGCCNEKMEDARAYAAFCGRG